MLGLLVGRIDTEWEVPKRCYNIYEKVKNFCGEYKLLCTCQIARVNNHGVGGGKPDWVIGIE